MSSTSVNALVSHRQPYRIQQCVFPVFIHPYLHINIAVCGRNVRYDLHRYSEHPIALHISCTMDRGVLQLAKSNVSAEASPSSALLGLYPSDAQVGLQEVLRTSLNAERTCSNAFNRDVWFRCSSMSECRD